jgi:cytosine/adenosine deaminase-related metal-dependent hydrolase
VTHLNISRRAMLGGVSAVACAGLPFANAAPRPSTGTKLPARGNVVIRNAYVMTMEKDVGDLKDADVQVRDGAIVAVGQKLNAPGAAAIDGRGMIVMPGLVETHWHMWNTLLRGMSGEKADYGYFRTTAMLGRVFEPADMYQGTRLAAAEAINSGMTFVHDWCHNVRNPQFAREDLRALQESGLRARFSYGPMQGHDLKQTIDLSDIEKLKNEWPQHSGDGLITLGMAWRGHGGNQPANAVPENVWRAEFEAAQRLGLPISVHSSGSKSALGQIGGLNKAGMIKNVQVIHAVYATAEEIAAMKAAGASISIAPTSELRIGFGIPPTTAFLDAGIPVGLSVDTVELVGNADMFAIMKTVQGLENGKAESEFKLGARRVVELATIEGARSMGIDDKVGSLKAGKRADLIMIDTRAANLGVFGDPAVMLVTAVQPANVDTVMVDGRILKRNGKLTAMNVALVAREASEANAAVRKRANWW